MPWIATGETVYHVENDNVSDDWTVHESRTDAIRYIRERMNEHRAATLAIGLPVDVIDELEKQAIREITPKPKRIWRE